MQNEQVRPSLEVPPRIIPVPSHLSPAAQAQLAMGGMSLPAWPEQHDVFAWRELIARMDKYGLAALQQMTAQIPATVETIVADGVSIVVARPLGVPDDGAIYLEFHGGSLIWGGGESCAHMAKISAATLRATVWSVDYRMAPDHPFPAALADGVAAYKAVLKQAAPGKVIIGGPSAGGNVAAATILKARDEGLPMPAAALLTSPELDLTESGDSFNTLMGVDTALTSTLLPASQLYAGGHDLTDPYLSPLFGDFTRGFPPTWLQSGTRDLFLSNTVRMHRALRQAGIEAELHIFEAATHIMFMSGPEADDRTQAMRQFADRHWGRNQKL